MYQNIKNLNNRSILHNFHLHRAQLCQNYYIILNDAIEKKMKVIKTT